MEENYLYPSKRCLFHP